MREDQNGLTMDSGGLTGQDVLFVGNCPNKWGWLFLHADILLRELDDVA